jgi:hypothetical protein
VKRSILALTHASRPQGQLADDFVKRYVLLGCRPARGSDAGARRQSSRAAARRDSASPEEVRAVAPAVLSTDHPELQCDGEGITVEQIISHLLAKLKDPVPLRSTPCMAFKYLRPEDVRRLESYELAARLLAEGLAQRTPSVPAAGRVHRVPRVSPVL